MRPARKSKVLIVTDGNVIVVFSRVGLCAV